MRQLRSIAVIAAAALVVAPAAAGAQRVEVRRERGSLNVRVQRDRAPTRDLTLGVGVLRDDLTGDDAPMAALRAGWRLRYWLRSELGVSYALADAAATAGDGDNAHLASAVVGLQAEMPWPMLRPYVGAAVGLSGRFEDGDGTDTVRPTVQFPVGLRLPITPRLGLQAEVRWRFDEQRSGASAVNREHTLGVRIGF